VLAGADPVVAVELAEPRRALALAFGATHALDPAADDAPRRIRDLTEGLGADCVLVAAGATAAVELALRSVRRGGTVVVAGMPASGATVAVEPAAVAHDGIRIAGSKLGSAVPARDIPALAALYLDGRLRLDELVSSRSPLAEVDAVLAAAAAGDALRPVLIP
jgi:Zn-dependent alcohol dehydrogenase